jgi:hypothetical protein
MRAVRIDETSLNPMEAKEASNVLVDRVADSRGVGVRGEARELRDVVECVGRHRKRQTRERSLGWIAIPSSLRDSG